MNIRIEKKNDDKFLLIFFDGDKEIKALYLSKSELRKLQTNLNEIIEYDSDEVGDTL